MRYSRWTGFAACAAPVGALVFALWPQPVGACSCAVASARGELVAVRLVSGSDDALAEETARWPAEILVFEGLLHDASNEAGSLQLDFEVQ